MRHTWMALRNLAIAHGTRANYSVPVWLIGMVLFQNINLNFSLISGIHIRTWIGLYSANKKNASTYIYIWIMSCSVLYSSILYCALI